MKKLLLFLCATAVLMACGGGQTQSDEQKRALDSAALKVAVMPTLDCLPLYVAEATGIFAEEGLDAILMKYQAQMDCDTALARGRVECSFTDLVRAEWLQRHGTPLTYLSQTMLGWQLLSSRNARIRQLRQLDDKMLSMTRYSATALLADLAVDSAKLKSERVFRIQVNDVGVRLGMFENNIMDALFLPEPQATQARNLRAHVLLDSRQEDLCLGVLVASQAALKDTARQRQTELLLRAYDRACDSINEHGVMHYGNIISTHCGVRKSTVDSLDTNIRFKHSSAPRTSDIERAKSWLNKQ